MAEQKEDHLSPEEKLLRVIQGGGQKRKPPAAAPGLAAEVAPVARPAVARPAAAPVAMPPPPTAAQPKPESDPKPVVAAVATPAEKSRLKVARGPDAAAATAGDSGGKVAPAPAAEKQAEIAKRVPSEPELSVRALNILLAACILIVLFFTGREIWANVTVEGMGVSIEPVPLPEDVTRDEERDLQQLDSLLDAIDARQLFAVITPGPTPPPPPPAGKRPGEYCRLLGISLDSKTDKQEAIVMDNDLKKMLYLKVGDTISSSGQSWTLAEIQADAIIFKHGTEESVVR